MKTRYRLTPQMADYDRLGTRWAPYFMYFHAPRFRSKSVNTDSAGFRLTYDGTEPVKDFGKGSTKDSCILAGGSSAFGVGATSDRRSIPSILNSTTGFLWHNFGGRAFTSTQELILFTLFHGEIPDRRIKKIVIFSGLNNLFLTKASKGRYGDLGNFFYAGLFNKMMNGKNISFRRGLLRGLLRPFFGEEIDYNRIRLADLKDRIFKTGRAGGVTQPQDEGKALSGYDANAQVLERDISLWADFARLLKADIYYILQPLANWVDRELSYEEKILFSELDKERDNTWRIFKDKFDRDEHARYAGLVSGICEKFGLGFVDMNARLSEMGLGRKWLFVDRIHLTDEGNAIVADIIKKETAA